MVATVTTPDDLAAAVTTLQKQISVLQATVTAQAAQIAALQNAKPPAVVLPKTAVFDSLTVNGDTSFYGRTKRYIDDRINPATGLPFRAYAEDQTISMALSAKLGHEVVIFQDLAHTLDATGAPHYHRTGYVYGSGEINQRKHHHPDFLEDEDGMSRCPYDSAILDILPSSRFRLWGYDVSVATVAGKPTLTLTPTPTPKPPVVPSA